MKTRFIGLVAALAITTGTLVTIAAPAQAAAVPRVQITKVYYNSPGPDTGSNTSLNGEWVRLTNTRTYTINLRSWTLRDRSNHVYTFTTNYNLGPGRRVYIHTGSGNDGSPDIQHRYQDRRWYVWNNTGDTAYLRNSSGTLIDSCTWGSTGSYTYC